jgi:hypothetical protein
MFCGNIKIFIYRLLTISSKVSKNNSTLNNHARVKPARLETSMSKTGPKEEGWRGNPASLMNYNVFGF